MMDGMTGCGVGGWLAMGTGLLVLLVLILGAAALAKYPLFPGRADRERRAS